MNQVELWLARIQRDVIPCGVFTSLADLARKLMNTFNAYSNGARPFRRTDTDPKRCIHAKEITGTAHECQLQCHSQVSEVIIWDIQWGAVDANRQ